jgi:hypothetical protein
VQLSPRVRFAGRTPRIAIPARALPLVLATCALTAGLGVGVLFGGSWIGRSHTDEGIAATPPVPTTTLEQPTATAIVEPAILVQPVIVQALVASDDAFHLAPPPVVDLDQPALALDQDRVPASAPMVVPAPPVRTPAATPAPSHPAVVQESAGRLAKIAPSNDGLPARVRAKPNTSATILARVPIGGQIRVLGPADGARDWVRVSVDGVLGYVRSDLIR